jgi:hypothetical protein
MNISIDGAQTKVARKGAWAALCRNAAGIYITRYLVRLFWMES